MSSRNFSRRVGLRKRSKPSSARVFWRMLKFSGLLEVNGRIIADMMNKSDGMDSPSHSAS
jgi:hypothetical protein